MSNQELLNKYKEFLLGRNQSVNYFNAIGIFFRYLESKKLEFAQVNQSVLTEFFNSKSYSSASKNLFINSGRNYGNYLGILKENNAFYQCKMLKVPRKIPDYLTEKDIENTKKYLITYCSKKMTPIKIRAIIDFMFYSGCRKAELLTLKRSNFNLEENTAKLYGKGDKERMICYPEKVKIELQDYFNSENEEHNAFNLKIGKLHYMMKKIKQYLGKNVYCHLFRHGFARNLIKKGVDLNTVSKFLGHSSVTTTAIYVDPDDEMKKELYKKYIG